MSAPHPLKTWIDANTTQAQFARDVACSEGYLSEILSGKKVPGLHFADKLSRATDNEVPIAAFIMTEAAE